MSRDRHNICRNTASRSLPRAFGLAVLVGFADVGSLHAQVSYATQYTFSTLAGTAGKTGSIDGAGSTASFFAPQGVVVDGSGNVYIADSSNATIRKISSSGAVTTFAGTAGMVGTADGTGGAARFKGPQGLAIGSSGNVFVADPFANAIREITSSGVVTTLAGGSVGSRDGVGGAAQFSRPSGVAVDANGNVFVADANNDTIRMVTKAGVVTTIAGSPGVVGSADGSGSAAKFNSPNGVAVDTSGNIYVADTFNGTIRKITSTGVVTTLAGVAEENGTAVDGTGSAARFGALYGITIDLSGNLYVADAGFSTIRMVTSAGVVTTLAGSPGVNGSANGTGSAAQFYSPFGIAVSASGTIVVGDTLNETIRVGSVAAPVSPTILTQPASETVNVGGVSTFSVNAAGVPLPSYQWQQNGVNISTASNRFSGTTSQTLTISNTQLADAGPYTAIITNGSGSVESGPATLSVTAPITYSITNLEGLGAFSTRNGDAGGPNGIAIDDSGNVYVTIGDELAKFASDGSLVLVAGTPTTPGSADGTGSGALFNKPSGIATDSSGNIYLADSGNNSIRKVTALGAVVTLAGLTQGNADGIGINAQFNNPTAVAVDGAGNVYVADTGNNELREIAPNGSTTTLLSGSSFTFANGTQPIPSTYSITGVAVNSSGVPYVGVAIEIPFGHADFPAEEVSVLRVTGPGNYSEVFVADDQSALLSPEPGDGALTIDANDNVYLLAGDALYQGANQISPLIGTPSESDRPVAIATDSHGLIYVANPPSQYVELVTPVGSVPNIATQPLGGTIPFGATLTLSVVASGTPAPMYQWQVDGVNIAGATSSSYTTSVPGTYVVIVKNIAGSVTSSSIAVTAATRLSNISSRALVGTGANIEIAGFVITGPPGTTEQVLIRGAGPSLAQYGVTGFLPQPVLTLFNSAGTQLATNAGWNTASNASSIAAAFTSSGAFAFSLDSADSAILTSLPPGSYTAQISGLNGITGVALAEVYEVKSGDPELINISTRAFVSSGTSVEIGGFVVTGSQNAKVLIRAVGPTLSQFGVSGVLAQPSLSVVNSLGATVASNTGWSTNSNAAAIATEMSEVGAFSLPSGSADSVLLLTLPPGAYTAVVSGIANTSGVALVEVYEVP